ncbi:MAG: GAF domain-containing sensor histidine kinase [Luteibaculaceae bacterium]
MELIDKKTVNEEVRLAALESYKILDSAAETEFNQLVELASKIFEAPVSLISLIDTDRQWFKAKVGIDLAETARDISVCTHAIKQDDVFVIEDLSANELFKDNPLVTEEGYKFYAGKPLKTPEGYNIGTLCVLDNKPREISDFQKETLTVLAQQVVNQLELRKKNRSLQSQIESLLATNDNLSRKSHINKKLIALMSHDLRSPIVAVSSLLDLFNQNLVPAESLSSQVGNMYNTLSQTVNLLDGMITWANKADAEMDEEVSYKEIDLKELTTNVVKLVSVKLDQQHVSVVNTIRDHFTIKGDSNMISYAVRKIIQNSLKYTENGTVTLAAELTNDGVEISVTDTGKGIPQETLNTLYHSNKAISSLGTKTKNGFGLGLTVSKDFIEKMGGKLSFENLAIGGTKSTIFLPYLTK